MCVLQGELARVDLQSAPTPACVGSAEATTCVIAIVHSQSPPAVSVAHFDQACLDDAYPGPVDALLEVSRCAMAGSCLSLFTPYRILYYSSLPEHPCTECRA